LENEQDRIQQTWDGVRDAVSQLDSIADVMGQALDSTKEPQQG
jgi:hypothetical protein